MQVKHLLSRLTMTTVLLITTACSLVGQETPSAPMPPLDEGKAFTSVSVDGTALSFEIPSGWLSINEPAWEWSPTGTTERRVGIRWQTLTPPAEAEAAMLPQNAVGLSAKSLSLSWARGRRHTVEVYATPAPAQSGETKAEIIAVETHCLLTVMQGASRVVYDLFASAPDAEQLAALEPVLTRMLESSALSK